MWGDPEYYVKRIGPNAFEIAKFTDSFGPDHVYTVRYESCTCPVGFDCKHVKLVSEFCAVGEVPMVVWSVNETGDWMGKCVGESGGTLVQQSRGERYGYEVK